MQKSGGPFILKLALFQAPQITGLFYAEAAIGISSLCLGWKRLGSASSSLKYIPLFDLLA
jgi:hypothetical protein